MAQVDVREAVRIVHADGIGPVNRAGEHRRDVMERVREFLEAEAANGSSPAAPAPSERPPLSPAA
jgi:hypothetical protein